MDPSPLDEFVALNRDHIIHHCRAKVATRSFPPPTETDIAYGVPLFLDQLIDALRRGLTSSSEIVACARLHGRELLRCGLSVSQVVYDYGDVCQSITDLAVETGVLISADDFRMLNGCLDVASAGAVTEYDREPSDAGIAGASTSESEGYGFVTNELRNLIHNGLIALELLKSGNVGVSGSAVALLHRSLVDARNLVDCSLTEIRFTERRGPIAPP